jgi:hypothetical protein
MRTRQTRISARFAVLNPKIRAPSLTPATGRAQRIESIRVQARGVAETFNLGRFFQSRDGDLVFLCRAQYGKNVVQVVDDTSNRRRLKLYLHAPGHRQVVGAAFGGRREQDRRTGLQKLAEI